MRPVFFFVKGGDGFGIGHVKRALAIAGCMRDSGIDDIFFSVEGPPVVVGMVEEAAFQVIESATLPRGGGVAVVDRKDDLTEMVKALKRAGMRVCLIDNSSEGRLYADVVIYPIAHYRDDLHWGGFQGVRLIGPEYFPLSVDYLPLRDACGERENILLTMGGTDFNNLTMKSLAALGGLSDVVVDVVVGPGFRFREQLERFRDAHGGNFRLHAGVRSLAGLMCRADLAVTAFGITLYELAFMGVPAVIINNYLEDEKDAEAFSRHGTAVALGYHDEVGAGKVLATVRRLIEDRALLGEMSKKGRRLVDGRGAERIVEALKGLAGEV